MYRSELRRSRPFPVHWTLRPKNKSYPAKPMSDQPRRTQIPLPGSSGETPTGTMQFQRDWPGLFIREDDA